MQYDVGIIGGAGHVGLPLGVAFAEAGVKTVLFDINHDTLETIKRGVFPFKEKDGDAHLKNALALKTLLTSNSPESIRESAYVIMVIGTPIDEYLNPELKGLHEALKKYFDYFRDGHILILRSTVYPGTSERVQKYFNKRGKNVRVAFCPERIVQGRAIEELKKITQIISAFDTATLAEVKELFRQITPNITILEPLEAELAKLFSNAWRYIKFAIPNQFYMITKDYGLDYHKIFAAMTAGYERNADLPSPGFAAGPCLFKDTMQLAAFTKGSFFLGHAAMLVNEGFPNFIIEQLKRETDLADKTIGILGMAFKAESDDQRQSLSYKLKKAASAECETVLCHDFYVQDPSLVPLEDILTRADIIILATPHAGYRDINPEHYPEKKFIDIWNVWNKVKSDE